MSGPSPSVGAGGRAGDKPGGGQSGIRVRAAKMSDARRINRYLANLFTTSRHMITRGDEFAMSWLDQRRWLKRKILHPDACCLVATDRKTLVAMLDSWCDLRARVHHVTSFTMSVHADWQGRGIGRHLLLDYIGWVASHPRLEKIELHVHSDNEPALRLYRSVGFQWDGTRRDAVRYEDGRRVSDYLMSLWPKQSTGWMRSTSDHPAGAEKIGGMNDQETP